MNFRPALLLALTALLLASASGCRKSAAPAPALPPTVLSPDTVASVHWVGKRRLDLSADAYFFSRVWSLPETARLQNQTFDRLVAGLWRPLVGDAAAAQIPPLVLRPLLEDLTLSETYLEIRAATGAPPALVLAIHAGAAAAGIWETNLAIAAQFLFSQPALASSAIHGWTLNRTNAPQLIRLARVRDWTVISAGPTNNLVSEELSGRIQRDGVPVVSAGPNLWLEADLAPARLSAALNYQLSSNFPAAVPQSAIGNRQSAMPPSSLNYQLSTINHFYLSASGDGGNVITRAQVSLARPFAAALPAWQLPADLVHEPLTSFTAVRGVQGWLNDWQPWRALSMGAAPDQFFVWSLASGPAQTYLAAPLPDARRSVAGLTDWLLSTGNPWLAAHNYISFDRAPDGNGVVWGSLPDIQPFIKSAATADAGWLYAGLFPDVRPADAPPASAGLLGDILRRTNLVYYAWEVTGLRSGACLYLGQTARQLAQQPQLPADSAGGVWLNLLTPRLRTAATLVTRSGPAGLTLYRRSTLGLTMPELQLLAGWLESPQFPQFKIQN